MSTRSDAHATVLEDQRIWEFGSGPSRLELGYLSANGYTPIVRLTIRVALLAIALSFTAGLWLGLAFAMLGGN